MFDKLKPLQRYETYTEATYKITPKGMLLYTIICNKDSLIEALLNEGGEKEALDVIWPDVMEIFKLDSFGERRE